MSISWANTANVACVIGQSLKSVKVCLCTRFLFRWFRQRLQNLLKHMYKSEEHTLFVPNLLSSTISAFPCPLHQEQVCDQQDTKSTDVLLKLVLHVDIYVFYQNSVFLSAWPWQCGSRLVLCCSCWSSPVWTLAQGPRSTCVDLIWSMPSTWSVVRQDSSNPKRDVDPLLGKEN